MKIASFSFALHDAPKSSSGAAQAVVGGGSSQVTVPPSVVWISVTFTAPCCPAGIFFWDPLNPWGA